MSRKYLADHRTSAAWSTPVFARRGGQLAALLVVLLPVAVTASATQMRFADVVQVDGSDLSGLIGTSIAQLTVLACTERACRPIPSQVDERDGEGQWVLDGGALATTDDPPGTLDDNDQVLFMAADAGEQVARARLPPAPHTYAVRIADPASGTVRWAYVLAGHGPPAASAGEYVTYDPETDRSRGARVTLGFADGIPDYLTVDDGPNLLDRLKVRASATVLFGLLRFSRSETDFRTELLGWRVGPIRVRRVQRQWVRLGWGIRSPAFVTHTLMYRDFAELPVTLRLNFPATFFFHDIEVRAVLDFRDLRGWQVLADGVPQPLVVGGPMTETKRALNRETGTWFAVGGPTITLLQLFESSESLRTVRRRLVYREANRTVDPPEDVPGEHPGIGYQLEGWQRVGAGRHQLTAISYALPPDLDVREFVRTRHVPLAVRVEPLPPDSGR
jgi:hypothetical protein